jgi:WD40 repeat protein
MWMVDSGATYLSSVRFSPDGRLLAAHGASEGGWQFHDARTADLPLVGRAGGFSVWYHPAGRAADGRWLAWRKRWTDDDGELLFLIDIRDLVTRAQAQTGKWPADDPSDLPRRALRCATRGGPPALGRTAPLVAVMGHGGLEVWDLSTGKRKSSADGVRMRFHEGRWLTSEPRLSYSPDDRLLAVAAEVPEVLLLDATGDEVTRLKHPCRVHWADFSPAGDLLATVGVGGRSVRLWDTAAQKVVAQFKGPKSWCLRPLFSSSGRLLMTASVETVFVWDTVSLREVGRFDWGVGRVGSLDFAPDGQTAVVAANRGKIVVWDVGA